jgi:hypothetical protein
MKRIPALAFLAATLISTGGVFAHSQTIEVKVPFNFNVGNQALPAGTYLISHPLGYTNHNIILLRSQDERFHAMSSTFEADAPSTGGGQLVFARYGDRYFLREVLCNDADMNVEIPTSGLEKRLRLQEARVSSGETVVAALPPGAK